MRDHKAKRVGGSCDNCQPHGGVAMQVEVIAHRVGDERTWGSETLGFVFVRISAFARLGLRLGFGSFALRQIAFMEADLAGMGRLDIDASAFLLGHLHKIPLRELLAAFQNDDFGPLRRKIGIAARGNGLVLGRPKVPGAGEVAPLAEQITDDLVLKGFQIEQRVFAVDRRATKQPLCRAWNYAE
jgi:hypothetical protein